MTFWLVEFCLKSLSRDVVREWKVTEKMYENWFDTLFFSHEIVISSNDAVSEASDRFGSFHVVFCALVQVQYKKIHKKIEYRSDTDDRKKRRTRRNCGQSDARAFKTSERLRFACGGVVDEDGIGVIRHSRIFPG